MEMTFQIQFVFILVTKPTMKLSVVCKIQACNGTYRAVLIMQQCNLLIYVLLGDRSVTLLELFLLHNGGIQMRDQLKRCVLYDADRFDFWYSALPSIITIIHQLMYL